MQDSELIQAFIALGTGTDLTEQHRAALLDHLKTALPKAARKAMRDKALVETIEHMAAMGLDLYSEQHGAIALAADLFRISHSTAARAWQNAQK